MPEENMLTANEFADRLAQLGLPFLNGGSTLYPHIKRLVNARDDIPVGKRDVRGRMVTVFSERLFPELELEVLFRFMVRGDRLAFGGVNVSWEEVALGGVSRRIIEHIEEARKDNGVPDEISREWVAGHKAECYRFLQFLDMLQDAYLAQTADARRKAAEENAAREAAARAAWEERLRQREEEERKAQDEYDRRIAALDPLIRADSKLRREVFEAVNRYASSAEHRALLKEADNDPFANADLALSLPSGEFIPQPLYVQLRRIAYQRHITYRDVIVSALRLYASLLCADGLRAGISFHLNRKNGESLDIDSEYRTPLARTLAGGFGLDDASVARSAGHGWHKIRIAADENGEVVYENLPPRMAFARQILVATVTGIVFPVYLRSDLSLDGPQWKEVRAWCEMPEYHPEDNEEPTESEDSEEVSEATQT